MSLTIELPPADEARLRERAAKAGVPAAELLTSAVRAWLNRPPTWEEIMAPVAAQVAASGMTEDEIEAFFQEVRQEVWEEKQQRRPA